MPYIPVTLCRDLRNVSTITVRCARAETFGIENLAATSLKSKVCVLIKRTHQLGFADGVHVIIGHDLVGCYC